MSAIDDDPATPEAVHGLFTDARELSRPVQVFAVATHGATPPGAIDRATLLGVEALSGRGDIESCAGSITVLMDGQTAGVIVAQPKGAPALEATGGHLVKTLAEHFGHGVQVAIGMATTAEHEDLDVDDAIAVAMEGVEVASASSSSRAVHSELYELTLATRRRRGTVYPLESVQHGDDLIEIPRPNAAGAPESAAPPVEAQPRADALGEFDDPFAHLASDAYELGTASAAALTNGIAPQATATARLEQESRTEIERLQLELEVARREKAESTANGTAIHKQERRIAKLVAQLDSAETEIERLRSERVVDPGVPSRFKNVQGLDPSEPAAPVKRVIIDGVFQSNRAGDRTGEPKGPAPE